MKINSKLHRKIFSMENFVNFSILIKLNIDSVVEERCVENLPSNL